jgi:hypothetical protein
VWFPRIDAGPLNDTYNVDGGGRNALFQYVRGRLAEVRRNHEPLPRALARQEHDWAVALLGPARYPTNREWESLLGWVSRGGSLLIAARWEEPSFEIPSTGTLVESVARKPGFAQQLLKSSKTRPGDKPPTEEERAAGTPRTIEAAVTTDLLPGERVPWNSIGTIRSRSARTLISQGESLQAVRLAHGSGVIVVVATDQIFSNESVFAAGGQQAALAVRLLHSAGGRDKVVFDESLNATGAPRVVGILLDPAIRPITVQGLVVLAVIGWCGSRRFGAVLPRTHSARTRLTDHTDALGSLYFRGNNGAGVLRAYLEQLRIDLGLRFSARGVTGMARIAERAGLTVEQVRADLESASRASSFETLKRREAAAHIRRLALLRPR